MMFLGSIEVGWLIVAGASPGAKDGWREVVPLPAARCFHQVGADEEGSAHYTIFSYGLGAATWECVPPLSQARYHHGVAVGPDGNICAIRDTSGTRWSHAGPLAPDAWLDTAAQGSLEDVPPIEKRIDRGESR